MIIYLQSEVIQSTVEVATAVCVAYPLKWNGDIHHMMEYNHMDKSFSMFWSEKNNLLVRYHFSWHSCG